jgi:ankyrin repeat protein
MPTHAEGLGLNVNSPCEADWDSMAGNDEVRFCTHCEKSVHNVSAMTRKDAMRFVRANEGGVCVRFYSAPSGRTLHANEGRLHHITRRASKVAAGTFGAVVALGSSVLAQTPAPEDRQEVAVPRVPPRVNASLTGTILDPNGALLAGANVTVVNKETGDVRTATTNAEGVYYFELLSPGTYRVEFEAEGFGSNSIAKIELQPGVEWRQDSMLTVKSDEAAQTEDAEEVEEDEAQVELNEGASCSTIVGDESKPDESKPDVEEAQETGEQPLRPEGGTRRLAVMGMVVSIRPEDPVVRAVYDHDARAVKKLIALGADVNVLDKAVHTTALIKAVSNNDAEMVSMLMSAGADVNMKDTDGDTAMTSLAEDATVAMLRTLIAAGAKVNHRNDNGTTPLINVAENDTPEVLKELLEAGAKVNAKNKEGRTALMDAVQYGLLANVKLLLDAGADVNVKEKGGDSALKIANELLAAAVETEKTQEAEEVKEVREANVKENENLRKLVALLVSYGAIE